MRKLVRRFRMNFDRDSLRQRIVAGTLVLVIGVSVVTSVGLVAVQPANAQTQDDPCGTSNGSGEGVVSVVTENGTETFCIGTHTNDSVNSTTNGTASSATSSVNSSSSTSFGNSTVQNITGADIATSNDTTTNTTTNTSNSESISVSVSSNDTLTGTATGEQTNDSTTDAGVRNGGDETNSADGESAESTGSNADDPSQTDALESSTPTNNRGTADESENGTSSPSANAMLTNVGSLGLSIGVALLVLLTAVLLAGRYN